MTDEILVLPEKEKSVGFSLAEYAQQSYLEYALSVVKGRALPDVCDGQKPVQRRILYAMARMGLGFQGANEIMGARPVKSARVVGDVLGRFHPHGDQAAYDALVRMAQDFTQRYPLIDGQGNFGSRDGDCAAAMRYTEARLSKISRLLLSEVDLGTVDFVDNYDGSTIEPRQLPARLPFCLLNGASGIAVGMATEIPSHNLMEIANACIALIKDSNLSDESLFALVPAPDYPGGAQIISSEAEIREAYRCGKGSIKVRAKWKIEELARGQWQMVVDELPPSVSSQKILEEIEELTNPKCRAGKKVLSQEQVRLKTLMLSILDGVRDESDKDHLVRLVFEPKTRSVAVEELVAILLANTQMECSAPINLTMVGLDGKPAQKSLRAMLQEWVAFRQQAITRRSRYRLEQVLDRIHILEGRQLVLLNIDEVIALIRHSDNPKEDLIESYKLSERQANDILEIRLRQLAKLEAIKIEQELKDLQNEEQDLLDLLENPAVLRKLMIKEIQQDAKIFGDERRTLVKSEKSVTLKNKVLDEPVTVVISKAGFLRTRQGHDLDPVSFTFRSSDECWGVFECQTIDTLLAFGDNGRVYSVEVALLPGGRSEGQPVTSLIELEAGSQISYYFAGAKDKQLLLSSTKGYGFIASVENMTSRVKAGKYFVSCAGDEQLCAPSPIATNYADQLVACVSSNGHILTFTLSELSSLPKGGKGLMLIKLADGDKLIAACVYQQKIKITGVGRGAKERVEVLDAKSLAAASGTRAKKGKLINFSYKISGVICCD